MPSQFVVERSPHNEDLNASSFQARMATALAPVELTVRVRSELATTTSERSKRTPGDKKRHLQEADGYVHFGDVVQLASADAKAVVAIDTQDKVGAHCSVHRHNKRERLPRPQFSAPCAASEHAQCELDDLVRHPTLPFELCDSAG
jgi:hypothetical protein